MGNKIWTVHELQTRHKFVVKVNLPEMQIHVCEIGSDETLESDFVIAVFRHKEDALIFARSKARVENMDDEDDEDDEIPVAPLMRKESK